MIQRKTKEVLDLERELTILSQARIEAVRARDMLVEMKLHLDMEWVKVEKKLREERAK